ncbi:hypothetical protein [Halobacillus trueperi]|uniref:YmcC n=1 Tax=Halobacillus trueperi TaxID=156205 RepID=A0A3E0JA95_9BACI|nr:hypothetical protein [Halobacillus trueperi]REJ09878.1 hypothetical protein DYE48_07140 [Halobacillus trueperi]
MDLIAWVIVASEIGFWVVIIAGLVTRYIFKKKRAGLLLLALTPLIDLILLVTTSVHLWNGATATITHGIAAVYIGVSVAFGKSLIEWADVRFQYYFTKEGPRPKKLSGIPHAKHYFKSWLQHVLAYSIGAIFLVSLLFLIGDPSRTEALINALRLWTLVLSVDLLIAISHFIWPKK